MIFIERQADSLHGPRKNSQLSVRTAGLPDESAFSLSFAEKQIARVTRDDNKRISSAISSACLVQIRVRLTQRPNRLNRLRKNSKPCHSERSEESLFVSSLILKSKRDSSLRSEGQNKSFFTIYEAYST
jgi:hypothetical protein